MRTPRPNPSSASFHTALRRLSVSFLAFSLLLCGGPVRTAAAPVHSFRDEPVNGLFTDDHGKYHFTGDFTANVAPEVAWDVLTDYNHLSRFVASMQGRVRQREGNEVLVEQTLGDGFLFIRFEVHALLEIHEQPYETIFLSDQTHKDFGRYQGVWALQPDTEGGGMKVTYMMEADRNEHTPWFITPDVFNGGLKNLLRQMMFEMEKREAKRHPRQAMAAR